jgi:phenylalanyl-tRNA synthetase beta chain
VSLLNPLSVEQSVLRTSLLPGLLSAVRRNLGHRVPDVALFEVGRVFWARPDEQLPREPMRMGAVIAGLAQPASWWAGEQPASLAHARGAAEFLLEGLGLASLQFAAPSETPPYFQAGACLAVESQGRPLGLLGEVHPQVRAAYDVDRPVFYLEMDLDAVGELSGRPPVFKPLPRFPGITLDMAMAVDQAVPAGQVVAAAWDDAPDTLRDVSLFDVYQGKPLAKDQKSLGLRFTYRDDQRTLTEQEVLPDFEARVAALLKRFGGQRRA